MIVFMNVLGINLKTSTKSISSEDLNVILLLLIIYIMDIQSFAFFLFYSIAIGLKNIF